MNKKIYLILPVCLLVFSSCRFLGDKKDDRVEIVPSAGIFEESLQLDSDYIKKLRLHGYTNPGETSIYMQQKQDIVDAYKSGDRSINLLRAYAYLSAFEADFQTRDTIMEELCRKNTTTCDKFYTQVSASGVVRDSLGKPISEATVEVIGTAQKTTTDRRGRYSFQFRAIAPSVVRLRVTSDNHMIGVKKLEIVDAVRASDSVQSFERNFTLIVPYETVSLDTQSRTIEGSGTSLTNSGYLIQTPYTKYSIPFDAIVRDKKPYSGKLRALIFEFDRSSGSFLLDADAFDNIEGFASQLFVTYGMPFVIFIAEDGTRLDVLNTNPMKIATSKREKDERTESPRFQELYKVAYDDSQKAPGSYPIDNKWLLYHGNLQLIPSFWVFDRNTGYWDNVGMRFVTPDPDAPYNIETLLYTTFVGKR